ncbi:hypothetical protein [Verrucosispora sp. WMMC514]|uniref:hypothetical protein n=1 Tax=Verrucosispora sp. WMMC514 TaxID=3015156 RepID=UPI00248C6DD8|nr:hypothetical protein [Verrucosispora sp. WMMC514]WBB93335.1 hypothetical protein O7597_10325 [Verrucosispora sp. WMMC514]
MGLLKSAVRFVLAPHSLNRQKTLIAVERLSALTHPVSSLEQMTRTADGATGGLNDLALIRQTFVGSGPLTRLAASPPGGPQSTAALHALRACAAVPLLAPTGRMPQIRLAANAAIALTSIPLYARSIHRADGSDHASFLVQAATTLARSSQDPRVADAVLWFLALQSTLNYTISGWAKMVSPTWRSGQSLPGVLRTVTYGDKDAWSPAARHPRLSRVVGNSVLGLECAFSLTFAWTLPGHPPAGTRCGRMRMPHGSNTDASGAVVAQIKRFAPGFREVIMAKNVIRASSQRSHNANYIGGDITGGAMTMWQTVMRPVPRWNPYRTPVPGVYLCSASTPPGPGVHGMAGLAVASQVLRREFGIAADPLQLLR